MRSAILHNLDSSTGGTKGFERASAKRLRATPILSNALGVDSSPTSEHRTSPVRLGTTPLALEIDTRETA